MPMQNNWLKWCKNKKTRLESLNKSLNAAVQERDVAVSNSNDLYQAFTQATEDKQRTEGMSAIYREVLRQRGGLSLTVQNLGVKPLPDNAYEYQVDLVQVSPNKRRASWYGRTAFNSRHRSAGCSDGRQQF